MRRALAALAALALASCATPIEPGPVAELPGAVALGDATWLVPGGFEPGRSPDGNSVILRGSAGAVLVDTGRHASHSEAVSRALGALDLPLAAIVNTHWHLDHVSGNLPLKAVHPDVRVYGTSAVEGALTGFLASSAASSRKALAAGQIPAAAVPDVEGDLQTIGRGSELRPDIVIDTPHDIVFAGRALSLRIAHHAVTERDLWIYDVAARRAIVGDLVTLPVPFFDTACPESWLAALGEVARSGAQQIVPGHGPVMDRRGFARWRTAFGDFIACARGSRALESCSAGWVSGAAEWIGQDSARAKAMADHYGERIRSKKLDGFCKA
ncbi:MBL fold metallo-hydrolase [Sphingopyxis sp. JAI128]|uniref:MBL fold metallo-hydrolase n=1 Tax=Sphingopyxis sp. JAI128 TaxID=2723066 RepID=UPI00161511E5|nr:MBL fold metallo-hydrolase [Sphingopyxis sp. JAI128]MBB6427586.1 glyoxylase-like metal-dependent hydrolase (beta-lactamase superfamily II) [Sphingopyxis sp. JAI128]